MVSKVIFSQKQKYLGWNLICLFFVKSELQGAEFELKMSIKKEGDFAEKLKGGRLKGGVWGGVLK